MDLDLKIISATDLNKSNPFSSKLQPYVVVSIVGTNVPSQRTPPDQEGGRNPTWNHPLKFPVPGDFYDNGDDLTLYFQIRSRRRFGFDKLVGDVRVSLRDLLSSSSSDTSPTSFMSYQVNKPSGRPKGVLTFSYCFTGKSSPEINPPVMNFSAKPQIASAIFPPPATGYPAVESYNYDVYPPPATAQPSYVYPSQGSLGYMYPPPPQQTGYGYPPQTGYGYPTQTGYGYGQNGNGYGYGYNGPVVEPTRKKTGGFGLGAGLIGGAVAGMLIGDLISD